MRRKIIEIDEEKCDGCGLCVEACHEGAIRLIDGKARLVGDSYCDGLGDCLGECPQGAIAIIEREADAYDEEAVQARMAPKTAKPSPANAPLPCGCPGTALRSFKSDLGPKSGPAPSSRLGQWPVQLKLIPPTAPFLQDADILLCADCVPFSVGDFHDRYLAGRALLVGCPKLDDLAYYEEKLEAIFREAAPRRITVLRMEVPCCSGLANAAIRARHAAAPHVPLEVVIIGLQGEELGRELVRP